MSSLIRRLKERKLFQWGVAYLAGAWLVLQLIDVLGGIFSIPLGLQRAMAVAAAFGFVVTLVLAWYHGEQGRQKVSGPELLIIAGVLGVAAAAMAIIGGENTGDPAPNVATVTDRESVAVLPFRDLSEDGDQQYFGDGIAEELTGTLGRLPGLRVAAQTSTSAFDGTGLDVGDIGRALGVAHVVEGSVRKSGEQLRIDARIVAVEDGFPIWSDRFDAPASDIFDVQEQIARAVADALEIRLADAGEDLRLLGQTDDHEAQDLYLRGRFAWAQRTRESLEAAVVAFETALERDPDYARALVGLGDALAVLAFYDHRPPMEAFPLAKDAARRALEVEPRLAEPHATLGYAALYYDWDWQAAEREFRRAIAVSPDYAVAHQWYSNYLVSAGRFDEAETEMRRASELDPLSVVAHAAVAWVQYYAENYEQAAAQLEESFERDPDFLVAHQWMALALTALGRLDEAETYVLRFVELSGRSAASMAALARVRGAQGDVEEARRILEALEDDSGYVPSYEIGASWAALGEGDRAVAWLERAYDERAHSMAFLAVDPLLASLHGMDEFADLLGRLRLD
jgi:TolB-like protein/Tfp pilus assembly protein PilF